MRFIETKTHGYLDYFVGAFLLVAPIIFGFEADATESVIFYVLGASAILYSLLTDYEFGFLKLIPMKIHLTLDVLSGILLAVSPWLFGFADKVYLPHVILGIIEIGAGMMTKTKRPV